jgi:hypothetical protein
LVKQREVRALAAKEKAEQEALRVGQEAAYERDEAERAEFLRFKEKFSRSVS